MSDARRASIAQITNLQNLSPDVLRLNPQLREVDTTPDLPETLPHDIRTKAFVRKPKRLDQMPGFEALKEKRQQERGEVPSEEEIIKRGLSGIGRAKDMAASGFSPIVSRIGDGIRSLPSPGGITTPLLLLLALFFILIPVGSGGSGSKTNWHTRLTWIWLVFIGQASVLGSTSTASGGGGGSQQDNSNQQYQGVQNLVTGLSYVGNYAGNTQQYQFTSPAYSFGYDED